MNGWKELIPSGMLGMEGLNCRCQYHTVGRQKGAGCVGDGSVFTFQ